MLTVYARPYSKVRFAHLLFDAFGLADAADSKLQVRCGAMPRHDMDQVVFI